VLSGNMTEQWKLLGTPNLWQLLASVSVFMAIFLDDIHCISMISHCIPMIPAFLAGEVTISNDQIPMLDG